MRSSYIGTLIALLVCLTGLKAQSDNPRAIKNMIAHYPLENSLADKLGNSADFKLHEAGFDQGVLYCNSRSSGTSYAGVVVNGIDLSNFTIEFSFKAEMLQNSPLFSMSKWCRIMNFCLRNDGTIVLEINNGDVRQITGLTYSPDVWYTASVVYADGKVQVYLNEESYAFKSKEKLDLECEGTSGNVYISTQNFGRGSTFKGWAKGLKVYNSATIGYATIKDPEAAITIETEAAPASGGSSENWAQELIKVSTFDIQDGTVGAPSRLTGVAYMASEKGEAPYYLAWNDRKTIGTEYYKWVGDIHIAKLNENFERSGAQINIPGHIVQDILVHDPSYLILLTGVIKKNTYLDNYPNLLYIMKVDLDGNILWKTLVAGGDGQGPQQHWFDYNIGQTLVEFNGSEYGIWFQVKKNWAQKGEKDDIHNGDKFVVVDMDGNIKPERGAFWGASHSVSQKITVNDRGQFITGTVGDAYPLGIQIKNQNEQNAQIVWPIETASQSQVAKCRYTTCAGGLEGLVTKGEKTYCLITTSDDLPINYTDYGKVDLLWITMGKYGVVESRRWITDTKYQCNDAKVVAYGGNFLLVWQEYNIPNPGDNYEKFKATTMMAVINDDGDFVKEPVAVDVPYFTYELMPLGNGRVGWVEVDEDEQAIINIVTVDLP